VIALDWTGTWPPIYDPLNGLLGAFVAISGNNHAYSGRYNRRLVFDLIRQKSEIRRGDLVDLTGLQPQTISNITRDLIDRGLITETSQAASGRGAPQKLLTLAEGAGCSIGFHLDRDRLTGVLCDLKGREIIRIDNPSPWMDPVESVALMSSVAVEIAARCQGTPCWGIGVAMPTLQEADFEHYVGSPGWQNWGKFELADALERASGQPVIIENDATSAAMAELGLPRDVDLTHFVYVFIGHGLGAGIIIDSLPFQGAFNNAGEIGLLNWPNELQPDAGLAATPFSLEELARAMNCETQRLEADGALDRLYQKRDTALMRWLELNAKRLRVLVSIVENLFDPQTVIVGGTISPMILGSLVDRTYPLMPSVSARRAREIPRVLTSTLGPSASAVGAAILPVIAHGSPDFRRLSLMRGRKTPIDPETQFDRVAG
jgi:predicted NBD/HSP70 family sugar kinase